MRIGFGYDVHRLAEGRDLFLGGVKIENNNIGLLGHSDADVLLHAVCDALFGAAALGDIGSNFPDTDMAYKNISSVLLLEKTGKILNDNGFAVVNIDCTVIAQAPKISPYRELMRENIAKALNIDISLVNVKGKTEEGLGFTGNREGISANAIALITKK